LTVATLAELKQTLQTQIKTLYDKFNEAGTLHVISEKCPKQSKTKVEKTYKKMKCFEKNEETRKFKEIQDCTKPNKKLIINEQKDTYTISLDDLLYCYSTQPNIFIEKPELLKNLKSLKNFKTKSKVNEKLLNGLIKKFKENQKQKIKEAEEGNGLDEGMVKAKAELDIDEKKENYIIKNSVQMEYDDLNIDSDDKLEIDETEIKPFTEEYLILSETVTKKTIEDEELEEELDAERDGVGGCKTKDERRGNLECITKIKKDLISLNPVLLSNIAVFNSTDIPRDNVTTKETSNGLSYKEVTIDGDKLNIFDIQDLLTSGRQTLRNNTTAGKEYRIIFAEPVNTYMLSYDFSRLSNTSIGNAEYCLTKTGYQNLSKNNRPKGATKTDWKEQLCDKECSTKLKAPGPNLTNVINSDQLNSEVLHKEPGFFYGKKTLKSTNCENIFDYSRFKSYIYDELTKYTGTEDKILRYPDEVYEDLIINQKEVTHYKYDKDNPKFFDKDEIYMGKSSIEKKDMGTPVLTWESCDGNHKGVESCKKCGKDDVLEIYHILAPPYKILQTDHLITKSLDKDGTVDSYITLFKTYLHDCIKQGEIDTDKDITLIIPILADYINQNDETSDLMYFNDGIMLDEDNPIKTKDNTMKYIMEAFIKLKDKDRAKISKAIKDHKIIFYLGGHLNGIKEKDSIYEVEDESRTVLSKLKFKLKKNMVSNYQKLYHENNTHWTIGNQLL